MLEIAFQTLFPSMSQNFTRLSISCYCIDISILQSNEIVQMETYLRSEGVLVRFWYPIDMLERPPQGLRKSTITGGQILDTSNIHIHR